MGFLPGSFAGGFNQHGKAEVSVLNKAHRRTSGPRGALSLPISGSFYQES